MFKRTAADENVICIYVKLLNFHLLSEQRSMVALLSDMRDLKARIQLRGKSSDAVVKLLWHLLHNAGHLCRRCDACLDQAGGSRKRTVDFARADLRKHTSTSFVCCAVLAASFVRWSERSAC